MEILGRINYLKVIDYLEINFSDLLIPSKSTYSINRREYWLKRKWIGKKFIPAPIHSKIDNLGKFLMPNYEISAIFLSEGIRPHRDHSIFGPEVVSVNLFDSKYSINGKNYLIKAGQVVKFNSKLIHSVESSFPRWSICFWNLPINHQLSLF